MGNLLPVDSRPKRRDSQGVLKIPGPFLTWLERHPSTLLSQELLFSSVFPHSSGPFTNKASPSAADFWLLFLYYTEEGTHQAFLVTFGFIFPI